ncbi:MAG: DUF362 domain-containing protein [Byssovorax sp.]
MDILTQAIRAEIAERRARNVGRPDRELLEHVLVALQRERVVAVGFDTERLGERLARTPLPAEASETIARAVGQIWVDENMHARYLMGLLDQQANLALQIDAMGQSMQGGMAGWVVSVQQLNQWSDAPGQRSLASLIEAAGRIAGKIPDEVKPNLAHKSLADYFRFNADAEWSAAISFGRMSELLVEIEAMTARGETPCIDLPRGFGVELERMRRDEEMHGDVFAALALVLGEDDGLAEGKTVADLIGAVAAVDGWLVPVGLLGLGVGEVIAASHGVDHPVGRGGAVTVQRGSDASEKLETFLRTLDIADFAQHMERRALASKKPREEVIVAIKPDLMMAYHKDDRSTFTEPFLVERLIDELYKLGFRDIRLCESQNLYGKHYANRSVENVARYVGYRPERYRIVDLSEELVPHAFTRGMGLYEIGKSWQDADIRISFAKMKTHVNAVGALTIRNIVTVVPQFGDHLFTGRLSDLQTVTMALLHDFPPHFGIIDAYEYAADGLMGFMADPTPKHPHLFVAGTDVICVDFVGLRLMGERDPTRALDIRSAIEWFGDPRPHGTLLGELTPIPDWDPASSGLTAPLAAISLPIYTALSGQGSYFAAAMDPEAFPPLDGSRTLAAVRGVLRGLLGHRFKKQS